MNQLRSIFEKHDGRLIHKWDHYLDVYENFFTRYQNKKINLLEFGVYQGGSLQLWKKYFGQETYIFGVDIDERCKAFAEDKIQIFIGDQEDSKFLNKLKNELPPLDIIIDDGGHTMLQQKMTLNHMWEKLNKGGLYIVEDLHTSYWPEFHGGYGRKDTFMETLKTLFDSIHARHSREAIHEIDKFTETLSAIHMYDSVVILEKAIAPALIHRDKGNPSW